MEHCIVYAEHGRFAGWPANNGVWMWSRVDKAGQDEILVGFTTGPYVMSSGHNIGKPYRNCLARSLDGGVTWHVEHPEGYVSIGHPLLVLAEPIDFSHPGFAFRVIGDAYHGTEEKRGGFHFSYDRGKTWQGPFGFTGLTDLPQFREAELTPRTDYLVSGADSCTVFLSARSSELWGADRPFCARTEDGGLTFDFVSWLVSPGDPYRAVMPSTVCYHPGTWVSALRRRDMDAGDTDCWIDAYLTKDAGAHWSFLSRIGETGKHNGNPPAMVKMADGRLCCVYGQRNRCQIVARYSRDEGTSWGPELVIRDDYASVEPDQDLGYPRLVQRSDGSLVAMYYWATVEHPHQHIAASIWDPTEV